MSYLSDESYDDPVEVCLTHWKFPPCRRDGPHDLSSDPLAVKAVSAYQRGGTKYLVLAKPEVKQDPKTGTVYVILRKGPEVARTIPLVAQDFEVMADLDDEGNLLGVKIW